ncbi:hypothetical protein SERLA73DRAFT_150344 [Serpula lacrymans var. lacrymans S7.3]|uniref:Uncharacterized protein n=1 Tax=Serpula lacrymans var. lacrymans (strain S7.3) TaxID=936435 RepID=F8PM69_SERL3|nr:hypothetical protein SERLA73DRAFT_150344 [Serpula lacrymans var. lacrymans S7.3]
MSKEDENLFKTLLDKKKQLKQPIKRQPETHKKIMEKKHNDLDEDESSQVICLTTILSLSSLIQTLKKTMKPFLTKIAIMVELTLSLWMITFLGHKAMRTYTVAQNGFPNPLDYQLICWDLFKAISEDKAAAFSADKMKILQDDQDLKAQVLEYHNSRQNFNQGEKYL